MSKPARPQFPRLAVALLVLAALALTFPATGRAAGTYCEWTYYSDATYTTIVGERIKTCQNQVFSWGVVTVYKLGGCEACGPVTAARSTEQAPAAGKPLDVASAACLVAG